MNKTEFNFVVDKVFDEIMIAGHVGNRIDDLIAYIEDNTPTATVRFSYWRRDIIIPFIMYDESMKNFREHLNERELMRVYTVVARKLDAEFKPYFHAAYKHKINTNDIANAWSQQIANEIDKQLLADLPKALQEDDYERAMSILNEKD